MTAADDERIAPVTYLFGAPEQVDEPETSPSAAPAALAPAPEPESESESESAEPEEPRAERASSRPTRSERGSFERISNVSMYALARRGMSSREMRDYLLGRDFGEAEVDDEIARLEGVGLLDDALLAETLVRTLRDRKGLGRSALAAELRRRNVDGVAIEESMGSLDDDELQRATDIAVKRAPQLRSLDSVTAKRRLGAFLMRKGYSGSVISTAVQRALEPSGPTFR